MKMLFATLIMVHWYSVSWSMIVYAGEDYLQSVYWSFTTMTTVGYGDIVPTSIHSTIFAVGASAAGAMFCAVIIANVTSFLNSLHASSDNIEHRKNTIKWFMAIHLLPAEKQVCFVKFLPSMFFLVFRVFGSNLPFSSDCFRRKSALSLTTSKTHEVV